MKHRVLRTVDLLAVLVILWAGAVVMPLSWLWYAPGEVRISDSTTDAPPVVDFARVIKRPVQIRYQVVIREMHERRVVCDPGFGPFTYRPDAALPDAPDLIWWTGGDPRCWPRAPGTYIAETCWHSGRLLWGLIPGKSVCRESNPFSVIAGARID